MIPFVRRNRPSISLTYLNVFGHFRAFTSEINTPGGEKKSESSEATLECPEEPTTCCMSGCANCVWLDYVEKLTLYYGDKGEQAVKLINEKVTDTNIKAFLLQEMRMRNNKS